MPPINVLFFSQVRSGWSRKVGVKTSRPLHIFSSHSLFIQCLSSMAVIFSFPFLLLLHDRKFPEKLECFWGSEHLNFAKLHFLPLALYLSWAHRTKSYWREAPGISPHLLSPSVMLFTKIRLHALSRFATAPVSCHCAWGRLPLGGSNCHREVKGITLGDRYVSLD